MTADAVTPLVLFDFADPLAVRDWAPIDDRVMGGLSRSRLRHDPEGYAVFEGEVSRNFRGGATLRCGECKGQRRTQPLGEGPLSKRTSAQIGTCRAGTPQGELLREQFVEDHPPPGRQAPLLERGGRRVGWRRVEEL